VDQGILDELYDSTNPMKRHICGPEQSNDSHRNDGSSAATGSDQAVEDLGALTSSAPTNIMTSSAATTNG